MTRWLARIVCLVSGHDRGPQRSVRSILMVRLCYRCGGPIR